MQNPSIKIYRDMQTLLKNNENLSKKEQNKFYEKKLKEKKEEKKKGNRRKIKKQIKKSMIKKSLLKSQKRLMKILNLKN